jgi:hypothetical protein
MVGVRVVVLDFSFWPTQTCPPEYTPQNEYNWYMVEKTYLFNNNHQTLKKI